MISEDHVTLMTGVMAAENSAFSSQIFFLQNINIFLYCCFCCIFDQINAALLRPINMLLLKTLKHNAETYSYY